MNFAKLVINGAGNEDDLASYSKAAADWGATDTMKWLRKYDESNDQAIKFAGVDVPEAAGSLLPALIQFGDYPKKVEPQLEPLLNEAIEISNGFSSLSAVKAVLKWKDLPYSKNNCCIR